MDGLSSSTAIASPATIRTASSAQPTYTTAGTIYKPNSNQPLQPPARRGRSFKWANGGVHTELSLLPRSVLATLPLRGTASRTSLHQQYSPLQQNYDRAVSPSPFSDPEHGLAKMPPTGPLTGRTDDSSVLSSLFAGSSDDRNESQCDDSETDDSDAEVGMDPLAGMPFKSLQNLASYPNPMQNKARKALNVAKPTIQVSDQGLSPPKTAYTRPIGSPPKDHHKADTERDGSLKPPPTLCTSQRLFDTKSGPTALAEGPGAPRPLTAGPPGQRQYRPATFESTWKALQTKAQQNSDAESIASEKINPGYSQIFNGDQWSQHRPSPIPRVDSVMGIASVTDDPNLIRASAWPPMASQVPVQSTSSRRTLQAENCLFTADENLTLENPKLQKLRRELQRFQPGTDRLTEEEIEAKDGRNDAAWSTGAGLLSKSIDDAFSDSQSRCQEQDHGVIGEGRPGKKAAMYPPMSINEANVLSTSRHVKPLLNVAFDTLLRYRDQVSASSNLAQGHVPAEVDVKTSKSV